jgi:CHAT domain-containing protein
MMVAVAFGLYATICGQFQPKVRGIHGFTGRSMAGGVLSLYEDNLSFTALKLGNPTKEFDVYGQTRGRGFWDFPESLCMKPNPIAGKYADIHNIETQAGDQLSLREIQKSLHPSEIILEYVLQEPTSMCLAVSRESVQRIELASRQVIDGEVAAYRKEIVHGRQGTQSARKLYDLLLEPISGLDQKRQITIIPGGLLHLLPFEALVTRSGDYVINTHTIHYRPSTAATVFNRKIFREADRRCRILAVGDPGSPFPKGMKSTVFADAPEPGRLHGTRMEVLTIAKSLKNAAETVTLLGEDASEASIKTLNLANFNILHFAVHGASDPNHPAGSALVLGSPVDETEDGILRACEVSGLGLTADLVVLSACDTAVGKLSGQDGTSNLVHAFLRAGARTVVGSIWPAEDRSTAHLMIRFYTYLARGMDKGSALRQAKLDFIEKYRESALPVLWAGMLMIGESSDSIF